MHALYYGNSKTPLARLMPDERWPAMWRIHWPDGSVSDMVNLSRAGDAAMAIAERGPPPQRPRNRQRFHWERSRSSEGAALVRFGGPPLPDSPEDATASESRHGG